MLNSRLSVLTELHWCFFFIKSALRRCILTIIKHASLIRLANICCSFGLSRLSQMQLIVFTVHSRVVELFLQHSAINIYCPKNQIVLRFYCFLFWDKTMYIFIFLMFFFCFFFYNVKHPFMDKINPSKLMFLVEHF